MIFFSLPVLEAGFEPPIFGLLIECPSTVPLVLAFIKLVTEIELIYFNKLGAGGVGPQGVYSQHLIFFVTYKWAQ
jgi:hypothetical protein